MFTLLKMKSTQRERFLAVSLVDLKHMEVNRLVYGHGKPATKVLKSLCFNYLRLIYHCFLYSLGLIPSTLRNIRLK